MRARLLPTVAIMALVTGCGTDRQAPLARSVPTPSTSAVSASALLPLDLPTFAASRPPPATPAPSSPSPATRSPSAADQTRSPVRLSNGWEITVYYTAVERFHDGETTDVTGCLRLDCTQGDDDLGTYPQSFVDTVEEEGTGRTEAGKYLNWSYDVGFWLDSAPRSSDGDVLRPFVSAAADPDVLPHGTRFTIAACGHQDDGSAPAARVCARLRQARWRITDEFTPGLGGPRHIDAYIGPETGPGFTDTEWYLSLTDARLALS